MDKKTKAIIILSLILAAIVSIGIIVLVKIHNKPTPEPKPILIYPEQTFIDSLTAEINIRDKEIEKLKREIEQKKTTIVYEIERIKELPLDSNIVLMKSNLERLGKLTEPGDTLPKKVVLSEGDTTIMISPNNVVDVNIIASELDNKIEIDSLLEKQIEITSLILGGKDSIINSQSIMIQQQDFINKINLESLQRSLEQEKKEKTKIAVILGGTTAVSLTVTGILLGKLLSK